MSEEPKPLTPPGCAGCQQRDRRIAELTRLLGRERDCLCAFGPGVEVTVYRCPVHGEAAERRRWGG